MKFYFEEQQRFTQWWLWLILISVILVPMITISKYFFGNDTLAAQEDSFWSVIGSVIFIAALILLFAVMKLTTVITDKEVSFNFFPFYKKRIAWKDIEVAKVIKYGFVGGWGIRLGSPYGTIYNVSGNKGLAVKPKNGDQFVIGTRKPEELEQLLSQKSKREEHREIDHYN